MKLMMKKTRSHDLKETNQMIDVDDNGGSLYSILLLYVTPSAWPKGLQP